MGGGVVVPTHPQPAHDEWHVVAAQGRWELVDPKNRPPQTDKSIRQTSVAILGIESLADQRGCLTPLQTNHQRPHGREW